MASYSISDLGVMVANAARAANIDPYVAVAQIRQESHFNPNAVSGAGAQGIAQFMPATWAQYGSGSPFDPVAAIAAYVKYMGHLLSVFNGRIDIALAAYNSGENRQEYRNAAAQGRAINWSVLPAGVQSQTQNYVNVILNAASATRSSGSTPAPSDDSIPTSSDDASSDGSSYETSLTNYVPVDSADASSYQSSGLGGGLLLGGLLIFAVWWMEG